MSRYDDNLIVVGAGAAGLIAAYIAATVRARVTLVERGAMGGDCLNTGCVPSKTLIASAKAAHALRDAGRYGVRDASGRVDFPAVMRRVREAVETIAPKDSVARYESLGVRCVTGEAALADGHTVAVGGRRLSARRIVLATGAAPTMPPLPGLAAAAPLTSENLWSLRELPGRLLVLGGGPIGCELAQAFARLGSRVTVLEMAQRLLPGAEPEASDLIEQTFAAEGIEVLTGHRAVSAAPGALLADRLDGRGNGQVELGFDRVLVATGRRARPVAGVATQADGSIAVDAGLRTSVPTVYACGDAIGPHQFTHMASHQAWYAAVNALISPFWRFKASYAVVPWATYTDPEVAHVGVTQAEAPSGADVTMLPLAEADRAVADGCTAGFVKVISAGDRVLGASVVARNAGDLIAEFVLAMTHGIGLKRILGTIHVYPTTMEANKLAAGAWCRAHAPQGLLRLAERALALARR